MQLFVSYARPDRLRAESLAVQLRQAGIEVWLDSDLVGGQRWWDRILGQLRSCDAVVAALSKASVRSQACRSEREYAMQLGKPVLPITLDTVVTGMLPQDIAEIQAIDYTQPDEAAAFRLIGAIYALPMGANLPDPLPRPPDVPKSPFGNLGDRINAPSLDMDEQLAIIGKLEDALGPTGDPDERQTAAEMLSQLATRPDLFANVERRIARLRTPFQDAQVPFQKAEQQTRRPPPSGTASNWWESGAGHAAGQQAGPGRSAGQQAGPGRSAGQQAGPGRSAGQQTGPAWNAGQGTQPPRPPQPSPVTGVSPHRGMAITTAILSFITILLIPIGIAGIVYSGKVGSSLAAGDLATARKASSRVVLFFWIIIGLWALFIIGSIASSSNTGNGTTTGAISYMISR